MLVGPNVPLLLPVSRQNTNYHAQSVDEHVPCFSEEVECNILPSGLDHFHDAVAPFDSTESVCGSSSSLPLSFSQHFHLVQLVILIGMFVIL